MEAKETLEYLNEGNIKVAKAMHGVYKGFRDMRNAVMTEGRLTIKEKELIAVGIAVNSRCHYCVVAHLKAALANGAEAEEIAEAISVAVLLGGGASLTYAAEAMNVLDQLLADKLGAHE